MKVFRWYSLLTLVILTTASFVSAQPVKVVTEIFTNTRCVNCYAPDDAYDAFNQQHPEYGIAQINIHNDFPYPQDPFYLDNPGGPRNRTYTLYKIQGNPWAMIDGVDGTSSSDKWISNTKLYQAITFPMTVAVDVKPNGAAYDIHFSAHGNSSKRMVAYVILTESHIVYDNSPDHNPPSGFWDNVFRITLPSPAG